MQRNLLVALLAVAAVLPLAAQDVGRVPHQVVPDLLGYVEDELVVVFRPEARRAVDLRAGPGGRAIVGLPSVQSLLERHGITELRRQFRGARPQDVGSPYPDLTGHYKLRLPAGADLDAVVRDLESDPSIDHVERIGVHSLYQSTPNDPYFQGSPNPSFPYDQWHLWNASSIDASEAWDAQTGSPDVLVGILDSGTRYWHVDLGGPSPTWGPGSPFAGGNVFVNSGEVPGNGLDDDGNGFVDDTIGWDFVSTTGGFGINCIDQDCGGTDNDPDDGDGHGTHTAGTVAAMTNNGILVAGVAGGYGDGTSSSTGNGCKVVPLRIGYHATYFGQTTGVVRMDWAAEAMAYLSDLVDAGRNVAAINCSWGSSNSGGIDAAVDALLARDVLIVHAAGNAGSSTPDYLGGKAGVMSVAATDIAGNGASFSNHGSWVEVAAPGVDVLSLYRNPSDPDPGAHYIALLSGTSMAAPHVAGIAALLESCVPSLSRTDKQALIAGNVDPYADSRDLGSGIANAKKALDAAGCGATPCDLVAGFSGGPLAGCAPWTVDFTDESTGSGIASWSWSFGDGGSSTEQSPSHTYLAAGTYSVSLTVQSAVCSDSVTRTGYVTVAAGPLADFGASATSGPAPLAVDFTDLSSGGPTSWAWTFGDGGTSSAADPSHVFVDPGTYTVTLTAANACGSDVETKVAFVTVEEPGGAGTVSVADLVVVKQNLGGGNKRGLATVTLRDDAGQPVAGATVVGDFSGKTTQTGLSGVTDGNGQVTFASASARGGGQWCFEVTSVTHASLAYAPEGNAVTLACESGPVQ